MNWVDCHCERLAVFQARGNLLFESINLPNWLFMIDFKRIIVHLE
jgi:hypothetical protein